MLFACSYAQQQWTYTWPQPPCGHGRPKQLVLRSTDSGWLISAGTVRCSPFTVQELDCWQHVAHQRITSQVVPQLHAEHVADGVRLQDYWYQTPECSDMIMWTRYVDRQLAYVVSLSSLTALATIADMRQLLTDQQRRCPYRQATERTSLAVIFKGRTITVPS